MNSDYAYVHFTQPIKESDQTINGELVQLNSPILEGETNLMGVSEYNRFQNDFPDRIKGEIIGGAVWVKNVIASLVDC